MVGADVTDLDRPPIAHAARLRRGLRCAVALVAAAMALGSDAALAADPPTILTAGIDAGDHLYVTWSLAAGTTYTSAGFASGPWPEPGLPFSFFAANSAGDSDCAPAPGITDGPCTGTPTSTSFTSPRRTVRDRRYFVKVAAEPTTGPPHVTSAVWVIDEAKPLIPGFVPANEGAPTNRPATGRSIEGTPLPAVPVPTISLPALPRTIRAVLASGLRLRVTCATFACALEEGTLSLDGKELAGQTDFVSANRTRTFVFRPSGAARKRLKRRSRAALRIHALVRTVDGRAKRLSRTFTVRR
jgi:hypothetical protein